ncbi:DUF1194 domain-containing protein [Belnapia sp. F-4-1]|uniref:DUF1194 domain-containing protein n=1 Tax=Belnapia sp. F-4-1 TaxID=1545443 RepID=UPI001F17740D|nr:DUF1194 domain-containing protein [Belnapia sp. F-4-1]
MKSNRDWVLRRPAGDSWRSHLERPPDLRRRTIRLDEYHRNSVIGGSGTFLVVAEKFESFNVAVRRELICASPTCLCPAGQWPKPVLRRTMPPGTLRPGSEGS